MNFHKNQLEREQTKLLVNKAKQLPEGQIEAVLSTGDLDRHGERVSQTGIKIPKDQVIKMYYNHETGGMNLPIGRWDKIWKSDGKLKGIGVFDLADDFANKVYQKVKNGFIDSISIGFYPKEYDGETATWTVSELVEASIVAEPANVHAVITSKQLGFTEDEFKQSLKVKLKEVKEDEDEEELNPDESSKDGAADTELKAAVEELKSRVGALEQAHKAADADPATYKLIRVRLAGKEVDKAAESVNRAIKVTLKEKSNVRH